MSRKISLLGPDGAQALSTLARMDVAELLLVAPGAEAIADELAAPGAGDGRRRRVYGSEDAGEVRGSAVVVLARVATDDELRELARSAPDAVLVVAAGSVAAECDRVLAATAFARPRVIGAGASDPAELAAAVVLDRGHVLRCVARCQGEAGLRGARAVRARVRAGGISEIVGPE